MEFAFEPMSLPEIVLLLSLLTALGSWWLTGRVRRYAVKRLIDVPNDRSSHAIPTPRGGGAAIVAAAAVAYCGWHYIVGISEAVRWALLGAVPIAIIGFVDDHGHVPARFRMLIHLLSAAWSVCWLGGLSELVLLGQSYSLGWFGSVAAIIGVVWLLNLFNFMDGIDGIAASEALFVAAAAAALTGWLYPELLQAPLFVLFAAACAGFLVWNWPPARIFMGDVGSGAIGFLIGVFAVLSIVKGGLSLAVWLTLTGVFLVDASFTLLRRLATGQRWLEAHRSHTYQHAAVISGSHKTVTLAVWIINLAWLLPLATTAALRPRWDVLVVAVAYLPLLVLAVRFGAGTENWLQTAKGRGT